MDHSGVVGQKAFKSFLSLSLIALSAWNPFGGRTPAVYRKGQTTETASATFTVTPPPSETITPPGSQTSAAAGTETTAPSALPSITAESTSTSVLPTISPPLGSDPSPTAVVAPPSLEPVTMTATIVSTGTSPVGSTESAEVIALQTPTPVPAEEGGNWLIPCLGSFLILLGIFLFWMARNRPGTHRRMRRFR